MRNALPTAMAIVVAVGCGSAPSTPPARPETQVAESPRPPVVVAIVIDQLPAWLAIERWPTLPRDGGFARLLGESSAAGILRYPYAHNATAMATPTPT